MEPNLEPIDTSPSETLISRLENSQDIPNILAEPEDLILIDNSKISPPTHMLNYSESVLELFQNDKIRQLEAHLTDKDRKILHLENAHFNEKLKLESEIYKLKRIADNNRLDEAEVNKEKYYKEKIQNLEQEISTLHTLAFNKTKSFAFLKVLYNLQRRKLVKQSIQHKQQTQKYSQKLARIKENFSIFAESKQRLFGLKLETLSSILNIKTEVKSCIDAYTSQIKTKYPNYYTLKTNYEKLFLAYQTLNLSFKEINQKVNLSEIEGLLKKIEEYEKMVKDLKMINGKLLENWGVDKAEDRLEKIFNEIMQKNITGEVEQENDDLKMQVKRLENENRYKTSKIKEFLSNPIKEIIHTNNRDSLASELQKELINYKLDKAKLEAESAWMHEKLLILENSNTELKERAKLTKSQNTRMYQQLNSKNDQINLLESNLHTADEKLTKLLQEITNLQSLNQDLLKDLANSNSQFNNAEKLLTTIDENFTKMQDDHNSQLERVIEEKDKIYQEFKRLKYEYEEMQHVWTDEIKRLTEMIEKTISIVKIESDSEYILNQENHEMIEKTNCVVEIESGSEHILNQEDNEIEALKQKISAITKKSSENDEFILSLSRQLDLANAKLQQLVPTDKETQLTQELNKSQSKIKFFENKLQIDAEKSLKLSNELKFYKEKTEICDKINAKNQELEAEIRILQQKMDNQAKENRNKNEELETEVQNLQRNLENVQKEFKDKELEIIRRSNQPDDLIQKYLEENSSLKSQCDLQRTELERDIADLHKNSQERIENYEKATQGYEIKIQKLQDQSKALRDILISKRTDQSPEILTKIISLLYKSLKPQPY